MAKYRKKPVIIEARQWKGHRLNPGMVQPYAAMGYTNRCKQCGCRMNIHGWVDTLEGGHIVCLDDWIITGVKGETYPCKPDIFEMTYELVGD